MKTRILGLGLAALALSVTACGGSDQNTQPQNASTTTTSGTTTPSTYDPPAPPTATATASGMTPSTTQGMAQTSNGTTGDTNGMLGSNGAMTGATSTPGMASASGAATAGGSDSSSTVNDGQISAVVDAANDGEIEQAKIAVKKAKNAHVKHFAQHMIDDHTKAESKLKSTDSKASITLQESPKSQEIKSGGESVLTSLRSQSGADFDKTYMDAQVDEHQKVLNTLDRLIPQAQNDDLKKFLQECRTKVAGHLKMAQDIQSELSSK
jgi:putative membrane protein